MNFLKLQVLVIIGTSDTGSIKKSRNASALTGVSQIKNNNMKITKTFEQYFLLSLKLYAHVLFLFVIKEGVMETQIDSRLQNFAKQLVKSKGPEGPKLDLVAL